MVLKRIVHSAVFVLSTFYTLNAMENHQKNPNIINIALSVDPITKEAKGLQFDCIENGFQQISYNETHVLLAFGTKDGTITLFLAHLQNKQLTKFTTIFMKGMTALRFKTPQELIVTCNNIEYSIITNVDCCYITNSTK